MRTTILAVLIVIAAPYAMSGDQDDQVRNPCQKAGISTVIF